MEFTSLPDLASAQMGGRVVSVNDEFFGPASNLLQPGPPRYEPGVYTDRGKWMDGWETRRRREQGNDWCIVRLGLPAVLRGVVVDTSHFEGNYPEAFWLEGCFETEDDGDATGWPWFQISPRTPLEGNKQNRFETGPTPLVSHVRLNIDPDGGVARLRVHGHPIPDWAEIERGPLDVAGYAGGGGVTDCSDRFFSSPGNLLLPGPAQGMWDGWETRRRRGPGHDWVVVRLGAQASVTSLVVDTSYFKGNAPGWCSVEGALSAEGEEVPWIEILGETPILPDRLNQLDLDQPGGPFSHVRLNIHPDGGVARFRVLGLLDAAETERRSLQRLNLLPSEAAEKELLACCESQAWAAGVAKSRPIASLQSLMEVSNRVWFGLDPGEWRHAADTHPRIGEGQPATRGSRFRRWSAREQAGVTGAEAATAKRLRDAQHSYEERFGHRFIVFASGKSSIEVLEALEARLSNDPEAELRTTADELARITTLRLGRMLGLDSEHLP